MKRTTQMAAMAILAFSGMAIAAPDDTTTSDDTQALRGPRVHQQGAERGERVRQRDGMQMEGREGREGQAAARASEVREMLGAMRALKNAEGDLALTEDQEAQIKKITDEQRAAVKAYMDEHKDEIEAIRAELKPGEDGERPSPEARKAGMEKIQKIMDASPAEGKAKKQILAVLTEDQQTLVKETIKKQRERIEARRERMAERGERPEGAPGRPDRPMDARGEDDAPRAPRGERKRPERPAPPADD